MKKLIVMSLVVCSVCAYADEVWDLINSVRATVANVDASMKKQELHTAALKQENWKEAAQLSLDMARLSQNDDVNSAYLYVSHMVDYAMCLWNDSPIANKSAVCAALTDAALYSDRKLGTGTGERIRVLRKRIRDGALDGVTFSQTDFTASCGMECFVCELPLMASQQQHAANMRRYDAIIGQISESTSFYRKCGEYNAQTARFYAKQEYENKTHSTFDPNDRPAYDSGKREAWDSTKRIYDIFGK